MPLVLVGNPMIVKELLIPWVTSADIIGTHDQTNLHKKLKHYFLLF